MTQSRDHRVMVRGDLYPLEPERFPPIICMTQQEFDDLPEYSATLPTGTTPGKRWKRKIYTGSRPLPTPPYHIFTEEWLIGEYGNFVGKNDIEIRWSTPILSRPMVGGDIYLKYCALCSLDGCDNSCGPYDLETLMMR